MSASASVSRRPSGRRKPLVVAILVTLVLALAVYTFATPYLVLRNLKQAVDARDAQAISRYVDYPSLRDSLKQQLDAELLRRLAPQQASNPLAMLGAAIGSVVIGPLVDTYATPDGVAALLSGLPPDGKPGRPPALDQPAPASASASTAPQLDNAVPPAAPPPAPSASGAASTAPQTSAGYHGLNEFIVVYQRNSGEARYAAIFRRSGLFDWKLGAVDLHH